ncbi:MAG: hypothetical protein ACPLW9_00290 [Minisyncoccales bacterium]
MNINIYSPDQIINFLFSPPNTNWFLVIKFFFIIISSLFIVFIILGFLNTSWAEARFIINLREFFNYQPIEIRGYKKTWRKIKARLESGLEAEYKLAVIEAEELFEEILKKIGYPGEELLEKLEKLTPDIISNINEIKQAHQIRNQIVYDPNYHLSLEEAAKVINIFDKALQELDIF